MEAKINASSTTEAAHHHCCAVEGGSDGNQAAVMSGMTGGSPATAEGADPQEAQARDYRRLMRKFYFAAAVAVPVLFTMLMEIYPALGEAVMLWHRLIGVAAAVITLPVLIWSGGQFFAGAWNNFRNHNANMDTLVALGTGAAELGQGEPAPVLA